MLQTVRRCRLDSMCNNAFNRSGVEPLLDASLTTFPRPRSVNAAVRRLKRACDTCNTQRRRFSLSRYSLLSPLRSRVLIRC
ncbi:hypothetical protein Pan14r_54730 [Crateriforma conspicua]|uniref:Uncharacterized protein n=1 Tax=Crateriforma conspicua TaxID=2527996 RepID=A0A5C5XPP9_9PLAN|nr:hypothetical protein Pan14r_54730 [Crateriforma conspicua]